MRIFGAGLFIASCALLSGCVDPAHSRFANKGQCDVQVGSHICSDDDDSHALTDNGDTSIHQLRGALPGGR